MDWLEIKRRNKFKEKKQQQKIGRQFKYIHIFIRFIMVTFYLDSFLDTNEQKKNQWNCNAIAGVIGQWLQLMAY